MTGSNEISLRDFFAGSVMAGISANPDITYRDGAIIAYKQADAMLAARGDIPQDVEELKREISRMSILVHTLRSALEEISNADYRGNRTPEADVAAKALNKAYFQTKE